MAIKRKRSSLVEVTYFNGRIAEVSMQCRPPGPKSIENTRFRGVIAQHGNLLKGERNMRPYNPSGEVVQKNGRMSSTVEGTTVEV